MDPLTLLGLADSTIRLVRAATRGRLLVSPKTMSFGGSDWQETYVLTMSSQTDVPVFNVLLGIWSDDRPVLSDLPLDFVSVDGESLGPMVATSPSHEMDTGWVCVRGSAGAHGVILLKLGQIDPRQTIHLGIRGRVHETFQVFTEVLECSTTQDKPQYVVGQDGTVLVPIHIPMDLAMTGIGFYVRSKA